MHPMNEKHLEAQIGELLIRRGWTLAVAESCTGGLLSHRLTNVPGSSRYFLGGVVAYANEAKVRLLGVRPETLEAHGAVSAQTAREMAQGARRLFGADVAVAITGIAGPGGGTAEKPVGLVFLHLSAPGVERSEHHRWRGEREENKTQSAQAALLLVRRHLEEELREMSEWQFVDEPIMVQARFDDHGQVQPVAFVWRNRTRYIAEQGRQWEEGTDTDVRCRCFLVRTANGDTFELRLDVKTLHWRLHRARLQPQLA